MAIPGLHDLRYGLRTLLARPAFAFAAIVSLAIGIGANTAAFSVAYTLLLAPVRGIDAPERLVELGRTRKGQGFDTLSYPDFREYAAAKSFDGVFAYVPQALNVAAAGDPQRAFGLLVSGDYFTTLRAHALQGRLLAAVDDRADDPQSVAVASYAAWQKYFAGDPGAIGRAISINGRTFTLVGVTSADFRGHIAAVAPDFYLPLHQRALLQSDSAHLFTQRRSLWLLAGARLRDGVDSAQAQAEVSTIALRLAAAYPDADKDLGAELAPLRGVPAGVRGPLSAFAGLLFALIGTILLVACVNVAGMLIARGEARRHEIATRFALGASRARVVALLFAESALLAGAAAALGIALAYWAQRLVALIDPPTPIPLSLDLALNGPVLAFALGLAVATALLFGLLPAWRVSSRTPRLGAAASIQVAGRGSRLRETLVVAQVALTLALLVGAGLFARALQRAAAIDVGFDVSHVVSADFDLEPAGYASERYAQLQRQLVERVRALPGVEQAALAAVVPLNFERLSMGCLQDDGGALCPDVNLVSDGFFATLGMTVQGRALDASDVAGSADVAVVNATLARRLAPQGEAVGRSVVLGEDAAQRRLTIVGVVADGKYASLGEGAQPFLFLPLAQWPRATTNLLVRTPLPPSAVGAALHGVFGALDASLPTPAAHPLRDTLTLSLLPQRIAGLVAGGLGVVGLLLAAIGLYGLVAYHVERRMREFGVKLALGAKPGRVLGEVLRRGAWLCGIGLAAGAALALALDLLIAKLLFGAGPADAVAFVAAGVLLAAVALLACWVPARRAAHTDPMAALRHD